MVEILGAVLSDGLPAVEAACAEALKEGVHSADPQPLSSDQWRTMASILNILARRRDPGPASHDHDARGAAAGARADCRLHPLRQPQEGNLMERSEVLEAMGELKLFGMRGAYDEIVTTAVKRQHEPRAG